MTDSGDTVSSEIVPKYLPEKYAPVIIGKEKLSLRVNLHNEGNFKNAPGEVRNLDLQIMRLTLFLLSYRSKST